MELSSSGYKVAILAANGFSEQDVTQTQRVLRQAEISLDIVSSDSGLVSGWNGQGWGLNFAVDVQLGGALGADYSALIVPGGSRSIEKLKQTAHTNRFIKSFMESAKPVVIMNDALSLLTINGLAKGRVVSGPAALYNDVIQAGTLWNEDEIHVDGTLMTGRHDGTEEKHLVENVVSFLVSCESVEQAA